MAFTQLSDRALDDALSRAPADQFVLWNGRECPGRAGSIRSSALTLVAEVWEPVPLRILLRRAARLNGGAGLDPDKVRNAVRMHQRAKPASYFLVRRSRSGDYVAVTDVPYPSPSRSIRCYGQRF